MLLNFVTAAAIYLHHDSWYGHTNGEIILYPETGRVSPWKTGKIMPDKPNAFFDWSSVSSLVVNYEKFVLLNRKQSFETFWDIDVEIPST